jgi:iron(III) transport system substrate-binding protein
VSLLLVLLGCRVEVGPSTAPTTEGAVEVRVYTSLYESVLDELVPAAERALPGVRLVPLQAGSEKIAQRFEAELEAGASPACLLATSDPAWFGTLAERRLLHPHVPPRALGLPEAWRSATASAFRVSVMVLAARDDAGPTSWAALADPAWRDRVSMADPLASGTALTTVAAWADGLGPGTLRAARANGLVLAGGNSAVLARMQSGERPVGVLLWENLLVAPGSPRGVVPAEGAVAIPGLVAIPAGCPHHEAAEDVMDWLLSPEAQTIVVRGGMHSPFPDVAPPAGAPPLAEVRLLPVSPTFLADLPARLPALRAELAP